MDKVTQIRDVEPGIPDEKLFVELGNVDLLVNVDEEPVEGPYMYVQVDGDERAEDGGNTIWIGVEGVQELLQACTDWLREFDG